MVFLYFSWWQLLYFSLKDWGAFPLSPPPPSPFPLPTRDVQAVPRGGPQLGHGELGEEGGKGGGHIVWAQNSLLSCAQLADISQSSVVLSMT